MLEAAGFLGVTVAATEREQTETNVTKIADFSKAGG
jgi:hypothetical protein